MCVFVYICMCGSSPCNCVCLMCVYTEFQGDIFFASLGIVVLLVMYVKKVIIATSILILLFHALIKVCGQILYSIGYIILSMHMCDILG